MLKLGLNVKSARIVFILPYTWTFQIVVKPHPIKGTDVMPSTGHILHCKKTQGFHLTQYKHQ